MLLLKDLAHGIGFEEMAEIPVYILCVEEKIKKKNFQREAVGKPRKNWR